MAAQRICLVLAATACLLPLAGTRAQTPFGPEFVVNGYTTGDQVLSRVSVDRRGRFMVVWQSTDQDGDGSGVFAQRFNPRGEPMGDLLQVNAHTTGGQSLPAVAAAADGRFMVVWQSSDGDGSGVFGRHFDADGSTAGDDLQINAYTTGSQRFPSVAAAPDGGFLVIWYGPGASGTGIFGRRLDSSGIPTSADLQLNTSAVGTDRPAVTASASSFIAVWDEQTGRKIRGRRLATDGSPVGAEFVTGNYSPYHSEPKNTPDVAADAAGNFVVVWRDHYYLAGTGSTAAQRFNAAGAPLGGVFRVAPGEAYLTPPRVSRGDEGFVTVCAVDYYGGAIKGAHWDPDGTMQANFLVSTHTSSHSLDTEQADVDHQRQSEDFVVVWPHLNEAGDYDVSARIYEIAHFRDGFESGTTASWSLSVGE